MVRTGARVRELNPDGKRWSVATDAAELNADAIVNCAGLHSDRVAEMAGEKPPCRIVPFRGEYYFVRPERRGIVRNLLNEVYYASPDPRFVLAPGRSISVTAVVQF